MYHPANVKTSPDLPIPDRMQAWVLGNPDELFLREKPVPVPARAEVLVRIDAVAICATDLESFIPARRQQAFGRPALQQNFTPGHRVHGDRRCARG
jgi:L-iditol 2-dehydrogenase